MSDLCVCPPEAGSTLCRAPAGAACPTNGQVGRSVDSVTLKALLARPLTDLRQVDYLFCHAPDCPTVYYSADGAQTFVEADLRERVYQKHRQDESVLVCYCFRHRLGSIRAEIGRSGGSRVVEGITAGIQAGLCACDIRNPQGTCCMGNVRQLVAGS